MSLRAWVAAAAPVAACASVGVVGTVLLASAGSSAGSALRYFVVWAVVVVLPGVLLWRAVVGTSHLEVELGAGAATGIALLLLGWLVATAAGLSAAAAVPSLLVIVLFVLHPRLRRHFRPRRDVRTRTSPWWWLSMAVCGVAAAYRVYLMVLKPSPLPPNASALASDTWYCLGIVQQLRNGFPVADPTYIGGEIKYHWFSLAVISATSEIARTSVTETVIHLWFIPFVITWLLVVAGATRTLMGSWDGGSLRPLDWVWTVVAAILVVIFPASLVLTSAPSFGLGNGLNSSSASGAFGGLFLTALLIPIASVLRGSAGRGTWVILLLLIVASSGMKPTVLPLAAAGSGLVAVVLIVRRRGGWIPPAALAAVCVSVFAIAGRLVIGSTQGAKVQPFAILSSDRGYAELFPPNEVPGRAAGGFLLPALAQHRPGAMGFLIVLVSLFVLGQALRWLGLAALHSSALHQDRAAWWCGATMVSGYAITFLLAHSGSSQQWFTLNLSGLSVVLTVAVVASAWPTRTSRSVVLVLAAAAAAGLTVGIISSSVAPVDTGEPVALLRRIAPYGFGSLVLLVLIVATRLRVLRGAQTGGRVVLVAVFLTGAVLPSSSMWLWQHRPIPISTYAAAQVSEDEQTAALFINQHARPDDVVVSNVFCRPVRYTENCDHSTVWVSALTGRRLILDGWIYTPQSAAQYDGTTGMSRMPSPFQDLLALSLGAVRAPTKNLLCEASDRYGARWIYADRGATAVSPRLDSLAALRFSNNSVDVYEIRPDHLGCA